MFQIERRCKSVYVYYKLKHGHRMQYQHSSAMPLVLQLHLVMISKDSKFDVDIFNTFWVTGNIKVFARRRWRQRRRRRRSSDHNSSAVFETDELKMCCIHTYLTVYLLIFNKYLTCKLFGSSRVRVNISCMKFLNNRYQVNRFKLKLT